MTYTAAGTNRSAGGGERREIGGRLLALLRKRASNRVRPRILSVGLCVAMAAIWLVALPALSSPAGASGTSGILILSTSVNGSSSPEVLAAEADGYTSSNITVATASSWGAITQAGFAAYSAIVLGDPSTSSNCASSPSSSLAAALTDISTWSPAVTGNVVVAGAAPAFAAQGSSNAPGANSFLAAAIKYAASGTGTGLYISLDCYYSTASPGTSVPILAQIEGGGFDVQGDGGSSCANSGTLNMPILDATGLENLNDVDLSSWPCSVQESFTSYPSAHFSVLGFDRAVSPTFTTADGMSGQPYVLVSSPSPPTNFTAPGGAVANAGTYGFSNDAAPALAPAVTADAVNPASGDYSETYDDLSIPTYGPALDFARTYDAKLAQQAALSGSPGQMGYGWTDSFGASVSSGAMPGDLYTLDGERTNNGNGGNGTGSPLAQPEGEAYLGGNLYIADTADNRIQEIPGSSGTQWGISMTGGDIYTIAGSPTGKPGINNDVVDTSSLLDDPTGIYMDSSNNLYIADQGNCRVVELAGANPVQWGITPTMTNGYLYTIAGSSTGVCGSTSGTADTLTRLDAPSSVVVQQGNLVIADSGNNRVLEIDGTTGRISALTCLLSTTAM